MAMIKLGLTKTQARIVLTLLEMDGASDYVGKTLEDGSWEEVSDTAEDVRTQLRRQGMDVGEEEKPTTWCDCCGDVPSPHTCSGPMF